MATTAKTSPRTAAFHPLYRQIKALITHALSNGEWRPGESIPPEPALADRYGVSQGTVRKAIGELAAENLLVRRQGKGTFVASHAEAHRRYHFTRIAADQQVSAAAGTADLPVPELLELRRAKADGPTAKALEVPAGAAIFVLRRLLRIGATPVQLEEVRLPASVFRGLNAAMIRAHGAFLYETYETRFRVRVVRVRERVKAASADALAARHLEVEPGTPLLAVERIALTYSDRPIELRRILFETSRHHYRLDMV